MALIVLVVKGLDSGSHSRYESTQAIAFVLVVLCAFLDCVSEVSLLFFCALMGGARYYDVIVAYNF